MPQIDLDTRVVRSAEPISATTGAGLVMMSLEEMKYFGLNESAEVVWQAMERPVSVRELTQVVTATYDVDEQRAATAVIDLVGRMIDAHIAAPAT